MRNVGETLEAAGSAIDSAMESTTSGIARASEVTEVMSSDEAARRLAEVAEVFRTALTATGTAAAALDDARTSAEQAGARRVLQLIRSADENLVTVRAALAAAADRSLAGHEAAGRRGKLIGGGTAAAGSDRGRTPSEVDRPSSRREDRPPSPGHSHLERPAPLTAEALLQRPHAGRGREPDEVRRLLESLDPGRWTPAAVRKGEGTRWYDRQGSSIAIERQRQVGDSLHGGWYLKVASNGKIERVPLAGNPVLRDEP